MQPMMSPSKWGEFISERCDDPKYPKPLNLKTVVKVRKGTDVCDDGYDSCSSVSSGSSGSSSSSLNVSDDE